MPHASSASLSGWYVISLRPHDQHGPVRRAAARLGARTFALSTLRLEALEAGAALDAALACPIVIVTSPAAARFAAARGRLHAWRGQHWFAVGPGTAAALRRAGIARVEVPPQGADAQALLAHPALASLPGVDVALLTAPGGRGLLAPGLAARGARVHQVDLYRRRAAPPRPARLRALAQVPVARSALLVSSGEALATLWHALDGGQRRALVRRLCVVSSGRLDAQAQALGFDRRCRADDARPRSLLRALADHAHGRFR